MFKYLLILFLTVVFLYAQKFPLTYKQLSHPLFSSSPFVTKLLGEEATLSFDEDIKKAIDLGFEVDATDDTLKTKQYLLVLRRLNKRYNALLYEVHKEISSSIDRNDTQRFDELTGYKLEGLLQNSSLYEKSLAFYKKQKKHKKNNIFQKRMQYAKIEEATAQEYQEEVTVSTHDSTKKQGKKRIVNLEVVNHKRHLNVYIENSNPYSISVSVQGSYRNLQASRANNDVMSVKAGERKIYLRLEKVKGAVSFAYRFSYAWILGSVNAIHNDAYIYRLPYEKGTSQRVSQGYNGVTTHNGDAKYAIDFAMDVGTKIYAARGGVVVKIKEDSNQGGYEKKFTAHGNFVTIEHDDATFSTYYHLKHYGVVVSIGKKIKKGDFLGYSGNTGYSSGPHLHFAVFKTKNVSKTQTIKIKLLSENGIENYIERNVFYRAK